MKSVDEKRVGALSCRSNAQLELNTSADGGQTRPSRRESNEENQTVSFDLRYPIRLATLAAAAAALAACSTPKPPPPAPVAPPSAPQAPPPERPAPPPVSQGPTGPVPGSIQDFIVNVGDRIYLDY